MSNNPAVGLGKAKKNNPAKKLALVAGCGLICLSAGYFSASAFLGSRLGIGAGMNPLLFPRVYKYTAVKQPQLTATTRSLGLSIGALAGVVCGMVAVAVKTKTKGFEDIHGSSRWATWKEIQEMGLLGEQGVYVGGFEQAGKIIPLRTDDNKHVFVYAPTRSGKGVSLILPTLLSCANRSIFVYDIKGENFALSAGWREKWAKNRIIKLDFTNPDSHRYNPLEEIVVGSPTEIRDAQNLAQILTSDDNDRKGSDHWQDKARETMTGLLLHCLHTLRAEGKTPTLRAIGELASDPEKPIETTLEEIKDSSPSDLARRVARNLIDTPEKERGSIISTFKKCFELFHDPIVANNTSASDFRLDDLVNGPEPVTLYFVVPPSDQDRLKPLVRAFVAQMLQRFTSEMSFADGRSVQKNKYRLLLMLDEFASMGYMPVVERNLAYISGYGLQAYLIVQDMSQIRKYYGHEEGITGNCDYTIAFAPNRAETADALSKMTGTATIIKTARNASGKRFSAMLGQISESTSEVQRALLTADECRRLPRLGQNEKTGETEPGDVLLFVAGQYPIRGRQTLYFADEALNKRAKVPAPSIKRGEATRSASPETITI